MCYFCARQRVLGDSGQDHEVGDTTLTDFSEEKKYFPGLLVH